VDLLLRAVDQLERGVEIAAADGDAQFDAGTQNILTAAARSPAAAAPLVGRRKAGPAAARRQAARAGDRPGRQVEGAASAIMREARACLALRRAEAFGP
jgi:hypothetical protein